MGPRLKVRYIANIAVSTGSGRSEAERMILLTI